MNVFRRHCSRWAKKARLTEDNIASTLKEVRKALLEADVALLVVKQFISQVRTRALGREVRASLTPGQQFLKVVQSELEALLVVRLNR